MQLAHVAEDPQWPHRWRHVEPNEATEAFLLARGSNLEDVLLWREREDGGGRGAGLDHASIATANAAAMAAKHAASVII